jgi:RIO kinase 1
VTDDTEYLARGGRLSGLGTQRRSQGRDHIQQLDAFYDQGLISEVLYLVSIGKEASVYCCRGGRFLAGRQASTSRITDWDDGPAAEGGASPLVAAKVYRARQYRFKNDAVYQEERTRGMKGQAKRALAKKTHFGREIQTGAWVNHEYEVLKELYDAGCDVPRPLDSSGDSILLEFLGDEDGPAPLLLRVELNREDAEEQFERTMRNVEIALSLHRVHGDLSAHNILWWRDHVVLIDFPQAVDARFNSQAQQLLERDVANVCRYFAQSGVQAEPWRLARDLWRRYQRAEL